MATFHINRSGTSLGTFSEDEVREGLRSGKFAGTDLGWREGMATWQPLAQISEFAQETGPGGAPSPQPQFTGGGPIIPTATIAPRSGLPWYDRQQRGILRAFFDTLVMVLTKPAEAFAAMKREGGFGEPLIYAIIGGIAELGPIAWQSRKPDNAHDGWRDPATVLYYFCALGRGHQRVYQFRNFASLPHDCWGSKATL